MVGVDQPVEANLCFLALLMHTGDVGNNTMVVSSQAKAQPLVISPQDNAMDTLALL